MTDDVDPEALRPEEHYQIAQGAEWHYVTDDFAETISLGPATDGEPDDDWSLSFTPEGRMGSYNQLFECTRSQLRRGELMRAFLSTPVG